ncbi:Ig-like domain-containing protein [Ureibacillus xyleni]|uniref:Ig-like domain-containing protein n=1 Tax=Ureibacillus xyleni TaxID=614648 RepID=A0A285R9A8_9BACL|nr:Ig-like domain-containing protein [Ureibacillus xyleni]SOB90675.1 Ig-like domain-containing protein [Ureibacillus xyleni]
MKYIKIVLALLIFIGCAPFTNNVSASEVDLVQKLWDGTNGRLIEAMTTSSNETIALVHEKDRKRSIVKFSEDGQVLKKHTFDNYGAIRIFKDKAGKVFVPVFVEPNILMVYNEDLTKIWIENAFVRPEDEYIYSSFSLHQDGDNILLNNLRQTKGTASSNDLFVFSPEGIELEIYRDKEFDFYPIGRTDAGHLYYHKINLYGKDPNPIRTNFNFSAYGFEHGVYSEVSYLYEYKDFDIAELTENERMVVKFDKYGSVLGTQTIEGSYLLATDDYAFIRGSFGPSYRLDLNTLKLTKYNISEESLPDYNSEANAISDGEKVHILDDAGYISHSIQASGDVHNISEKYIAVTSKDRLAVYERESGDKVGEVSGNYDRVYPGKNDNGFYATNDDSWAYYSIGKANVGPTYEPTKQWTISFSTEIDASTVTPTTIYVTNKEGQKAAVATKVEGSKIYLSAPASGYVSGETYTLHITDAVKAKSGSKLKNGVTKVFSIR